MKKSIAILLTLCLILALCPMAMADFSPVGTVDGYAAGLMGSNLLVREKNGGKDICTLDGTVLKHFDRTDYYVTDGDNCLIVVDASVGKYGAVGVDGRDIIPYAYDNIWEYSIWAMATTYVPGTDEDFDAQQYVDGEWLPLAVEKADLYNLQTGELVASMDRDAYASWYAEEGYVNIVDREGTIHTYNSDFEELDAEVWNLYDFSFAIKSYTDVMDEDTWLYALADPEGNLLTEPMFASINVFNAESGYFEVYNEDDQYGLLNTAGELVVPMEHEEILTVQTTYFTSDVYETAGIVAVKNGDTVTMINLADGTTVDVDCTGADWISFYGTCLRVQTEDGELFYGADGQQIQFPENVEVEYLDEWVMPYGTYFVGSDVDWSCEYILSDSGEILLQAYDVVGFTTDGHALTYDMDTGVTSVYEVK